MWEDVAWCVFTSIATKFSAITPGNLWVTCPGGRRNDLVHHFSELDGGVVALCTGSTSSLSPQQFLSIAAASHSLCMVVHLLFWRILLAILLSFPPTNNGLSWKHSKQQQQKRFVCLNKEYYELVVIRAVRASLSSSFGAGICIKGKTGW